MTSTEKMPIRNGAPTTPEANAYHNLTTKGDESGERDYIPDDYAIKKFRMRGRLDPFALSDTTREYLGIEHDFTHTYVRDPKIYAKEEGRDRVREMQDDYPAAELVRDPVSGDPMTCGDMVLIKYPKVWLDEKQKMIDAAANIYTMSNPVLAAEHGITPQEAAQYREQYSEEYARYLGFDPNDPKQKQIIRQNAINEARSRQSSHASPTYRQTYDDAVESKVKQIAQSMGVDPDSRAGRAKATRYYEKEYLPSLERKARLGAERDPTSTWKQQMQAARAMTEGISFNIGADYADDASEVLKKRKTGERQQGRQRF